MQIDTRGPKEISPLTDSLASRIRWRLCDYEAMLRAQVELLLDSDDSDDLDIRHARIGQAATTRSGVVRQ